MEGKGQGQGKEQPDDRECAGRRLCDPERVSVREPPIPSSLAAAGGRRGAQAAAAGLAEPGSPGAAAAEGYRPAAKENVVLGDGRVPDQHGRRSR